MNAIISPGQIEAEPIEFEPCELCGCAIEDLEELIYLRAADLIAEWERADPRDAWRHTGEHPPKSECGSLLPPQSRPYHTPQATIDAFLHLARHDRGRLAGWLADHPRDAPELFKLWKATT